MSLTDILKDPQPPTAHAATVNRPPGITCEKYSPGPDGKRCASYLANGACARPDELMCVEWTKRNPSGPDVASPKTPPPDSSRSRAASGAPPLTREDAESFKKLGVEVQIESPHGTFWLVPARTGQDRMELTPEEMVTLVNVVHVFGGRIISLARDGRPLPDADPTALAEAASLLSNPEPAQADRRAEAHEVRPAGEPGGPRGLPGPVVGSKEPSPEDAREHLRRLSEHPQAPAGAPAVPAQTGLFDLEGTR